MLFAFDIKSHAPILTQPLNAEDIGPAYSPHGVSPLPSLGGPHLGEALIYPRVMG